MRSGLGLLYPSCPGRRKNKRKEVTRRREVTSQSLLLECAKTGILNYASACRTKRNQNAMTRGL
eukprot:6787034-Pyramimonas_sp.AAC.1